MEIFLWQSIELSHCLQHLKHYWFEFKMISLNFISDYSRIYGLKGQHCIVSNDFISIIYDVDNVVILWLPLVILPILTFLNSLCINQIYNGKKIIFLNIDWIYSSVRIQISHILYTNHVSNRSYTSMFFFQPPCSSSNFWIKLKFNKFILVHARVARAILSTQQTY